MFFSKIKMVSQNCYSLWYVGSFFPFLCLPRFYYDFVEIAALRKNLCKFKNCDKSDILERLKNNRSNFFTVYNGYCNLSRFFGYQPAGMERSGMESGWYPAAQPSLSGYMISSSPRTLPQFRSGIVHFLAISCVARYRAFRSAVSLGNTLLCLFRRR